MSNIARSFIFFFCFFLNPARLFVYLLAVSDPLKQPLLLLLLLSCRYVWRIQKDITNSLRFDQTKKKFRGMNGRKGSSGWVGNEPFWINLNEKWKKDKNDAASLRPHMNHFKLTFLLNARSWKNIFLSLGGILMWNSWKWVMKFC